MKDKIYASLIVGVLIAVAILIRPQIARTTGPSSQWTLEPTDEFPNGLMAAGDDFGINANLLEGKASSAFQQKIVTKYAHVGGGNTSNTTASSGSPADMPSTTISFSSGEITGTTKLVINYASRITNSVSAVHTATYINVDGSDVAMTLIQSPSSTAWVQHATNAVVEVSSGSHTVKIRWSNWEGNGTATVADRDVTVMAIPE
jgi:hypothetical protein